MSKLFASALARVQVLLEQLTEARDEIAADVALGMPLGRDLPAERRVGAIVAHHRACHLRRLARPIPHAPPPRGHLPPTRSR